MATGSGGQGAHAVQRDGAAAKQDLAITFETSETVIQLLYSPEATLSTKALPPLDANKLIRFI